MRKTVIGLLAGLVLLIGCNSAEQRQNHFSLSSDTLVIKTSRQKGLGSLGTYLVGAGQLGFSDSERANYISNHILPDNIQEIEIGFFPVDFKPYYYEWHETEEYWAERFPSYVSSNKIDTLNIPSFYDNNISILIGLQNGEPIFIVDQNNNHDFRDDTIRKLQKLDWLTNDDLIYVQFKIYNEKQVIDDYSWINVGLYGNHIFCFASHHLSADFFIDNQKFTLEIFNHQSGIAIDNPLMIIPSIIDTINEVTANSETIKIKEFIKLNGEYYQFAHITNDGSYVTLIKERNFENQIGLQPGMIAPEFKAKTIAGDTISLNEFKGDYLLLVNHTSCWSEITTYQHHKEISEVYKDRIRYIGIDNSHRETLLRQIQNLSLPGDFLIAENENPEIEEHFRPDFSSRTCFLICPAGRVIERFEISYWNENLSRHFENDL